ncbi:MAG: helix-turn-helix domain-containing protein [Actinomycetia bacterium]|nr:helix-turn-helix domain-containing protein [Actinomycetes bacterium]MCP4085266.1 helix-turn-helix domain-containing protein [Actinomycetes bacterium]
MSGEILAELDMLECELIIPTSQPLTVREAADHLRLSPKTVRLYIEKGYLSARKAGHRYLLDPCEVHTFELRAHPVVPES